MSSIQDAFHTLVVQQIERLPGVCEAIGSNPAGISNFLFLSRSWHTIITPLSADCIFLCKLKKWLNGNANTGDTLLLWATLCCITWGARHWVVRGMKFQRDSIAHPRRPRGGQLGQEKRRWKFSRTGERALGIALITKQFHDLFECLSVIGAQSEASIPATVSLFREAFFQKSFYWKWAPKVYSTSFYHWREKFNKLIFKGQKNFFCTYLTSMPSKKKIMRFVVFCILASFVWCCWWFVVCLTSCYARSCLFGYPEIGSQEQTVKHELKRARKWIENSNISVTLTFTSVGAKLRSTALKVFENARFLILLKWYVFFF